MDESHSTAEIPILDLPSRPVFSDVADGLEVIRPALPAVFVGPFRVADASASTIISQIAAPTGRRTVAMALHVGGLNHYEDDDFAKAMNASDVVYCDGKSVQLIARRAGATRIERAATTDIGLPILVERAAALRRPLRLALVGGEAGLAEEAGQHLMQQANVQIVMTDHGYHQNWDSTVAHLDDADPDVILVGMGMPREAKWVHDHLEDLPKALILTCGGWLGFLAGRERRAPGLAQRSGAEWIFRVLQSPRRLGPRYLHGIVSTAKLYAEAGRNSKR